MQVKIRSALCIAMILLGVSTAQADFDFELDLPSSTIEDNLTIDFFFENTLGATSTNVMQIFIGETREDSTGILVNIRPGSEFMEIGESGKRGGFIGGGAIGGDTIINGSRVRVNYELSGLTIWSTNTYRMRINFNFRNKDFEGFKRIYMDARDAQGTWGGMRQVATVTINQPEETTSRHRPEVMSFDPYWTNPEHNRRANFTLYLRDRDGYTDLRSARLTISNFKDFGVFGGPGYMINYIVINMDFAAGTYTVYDLNRGYYAPITKSIGSTGWIRLQGASVRVAHIVPDRYDPDDSAEIKIQYVFNLQWAGTYKATGQAQDNSWRSSGSRNLGEFTVDGGRSAPVPRGLMPTSVNVTHNNAPGDQIPLNMNFWIYDADSAQDIKFFDIKFGKSTSDGDNVFFLRIYPWEDRWFVDTSPRDFNHNDSDPVRGFKTLSGVGRADGRELDISTTSSNEIRVQLPFLFFEEFSGDWNVYLRAMDYNENKSGWTKMGEITVGYENKTPVPMRQSLQFDLGIITSQYQFRDDDGPNNIETIEFALTDRNPDLITARTATLTYDNRHDRLVIYSAGRRNQVNNVSSRPQHTRRVGDLRVYIPQTRKVGLVDNIMYFFLCAQLMPHVDEGLYLIYARCTDTDGNQSRWVLLSTYKHEADTPLFRP